MDAIIIQQIKHDLEILNNLPEKCYDEISQLGYEFIVAVRNKNIIKQLAVAANIEPEEIENVITSIALLLYEIHKGNISEDEFKKEVCGFLSPLASNAIYSVYKQHKAELTSNLRDFDFHSTSYKNLQWRLESQLASRSLRGGFEPRVVLKLSVEKMGKEENIGLVSDIPNIKHWNKMVEEALCEARTQNSRRLQRTTM